MAVPIKFTADMSDVRRAFDNLRSDASRGVPLGGFSANAGGIGFSAAPTVATILGQKMVITNPAWAAALAGQGVGGGTPAGGEAVSAGGQAAAVLGGSGGGGGFSASRGGLGFFGAGFRGLIGAGYATHMGFAAAESYRQYSIDSVLGGNDQRAQLEATLKYRSALASDFGFIGRAVAFVQDSTGNDEAGIRATTGMADAQDVRTQAIASTASNSQRLTDRANVAAITNPYEKRLAQARAVHDEEIRMIEERGRKQGEIDAKEIAAKRAQLDADREKTIDQRLSRLSFTVSAAELSAGQGSEERAKARERIASEVDNENDQTISTMRGERAAAVRRTGNRDRASVDRFFGSETREITRDETFRREGAISGYGFASREAGFSIIGDLVGERRARRAGGVDQRMRRVGQNRAGFGEFAAAYGAEALGALADEVGDARDRYFGIQDAKYSAAVARDVLARDPLRAAQDALEAQRQQAIRGKTREEADALNSEFSLRGKVIEQKYGDELSLRDTALSNRGAYLSTLLRDDRYSGIAAQSLAIKDEAFLKVQELGLSNGGARNNSAIRQVLSNSQTEQQLLVKNLIGTFTPQSISVNQTDLSGGGHGGNVQKSLDDIAKNTADAAKKLDNLGKAL